MIFRKENKYEKFAQFLTKYICTIFDQKYLDNFLPKIFG